MKRTTIKKPAFVFNDENLKKQIESNRDFIRSLHNNDKALTAKVLIRDILNWAALSDVEAIGIIESTKLKFLLNTEDKEPKS